MAETAVLPHSILFPQLGDMVEKEPILIRHLQQAVIMEGLHITVVVVEVQVLGAVLELQPAGDKEQLYTQVMAEREPQQPLGDRAKPLAVVVVVVGGGTDITPIPGQVLEVPVVEMAQAHKAILLQVLEP